MKKLIYISVICFLMISLASCYSTKTLTSQKEFQKCLKKRDGNYEVNKKTKVLKVITKEGDSIVFNANFPGKVSELKVFGFPQVFLPYNTIDSNIFSTNNLLALWKDGVRYEFITQDSSGFVCYFNDTLNIPFEEIENMQVRQLNKGATAAAYILGVTIPGTIVVFAVSMKRMTLFDEDTWK